MEKLLPAILSLALVLGLMFMLFWILKHVSSGRVKSFGSSSRIKILERVNLAPDKFLLIVRVDDKTLFLGVSSSGISKLDELENIEYEESNKAFDNTFLSNMKRIISAKKSSKTDDTAKEVSDDDKISY